MIVAALALTARAVDRSDIGRAEARQAMNQSGLIGYQVAFQITQNPKSIAPATSDQLTIIFANRSVEAAAPPRPFFGDDIVQEFSFSGQDFVNDQLRFTRRVNDKSFLNARYIRVINHGTGGWGGDTISLSVDGQEILRNVRMAPRLGNPSKGFQNFNRRDWRLRSYWEAELSQLRGRYAK
jgi:hypothetical protein